jgi:hypothetical protein
MSNKNLLTAIDMDNNSKSINNIIEERVIQFTKKIIRIKLKELRDLRKIELNNSDENFKLSKEETEAETLKIINSSEVRNYREKEYQNLENEKTNF